MGKHTAFGMVAIAVGAMSVAAIPAAQARPDSTRMSCSAARSLVAGQGGVVMGTGPSLFDRYVVSRAFCASTQVTEPAFVPATDNPQCFVGYTCRERRSPI